MLHRRPSPDWSKGYWRKRQVLFSNCKPFFRGIPSVFQCPSAIPRDCLKGVEFVPQSHQHLKSLKIHSYATLAAHWGVAYARKACVFGGPSCLEDSFSKKKSRGKTSWKSEAGVLQFKNFQDHSNLNKIPSPNTLPPKKKRLHPIFFSEPVDCAKDFSVISKPLTYFDSYGSAAVTGSEATSPWWFQVTNYRHGNRLHAF